MQQYPKLTVEQIRTLNNPLRLEILTLLRAEGPLTAAEMGQKLDKDELLLYYHLKRLSAAGLIFTSGSKQTATKPETVFRAGQPAMVENIDLNDDANRRELKRNVETILRAASREYGAAIDDLLNDSFDECTLMRLSFSLTEEDYNELRKRLFKLADWVRKRPRSGAKYTFTLAVAPLPRKE